MRKSKGITLIALIITIIVLLILAGISISVLTGENGVLSQAQESKEKTDKARIQEIRELTSARAGMNLEGYYYNYETHQVVESKTSKTIYIPSGFAVSEVTEEVAGKGKDENEVETGLVIIDKYGDEFVWVPVKSDGSDFTRKISSNWKIKFDEDSSNSEITNLRDNFGNNKLLSGSKSGGEAIYDKELENVKKAGGFFVSRYEIGADGAEQRNLTGIDSISYYSKFGVADDYVYTATEKELYWSQANDKQKVAIIDRILPQLQSKKGVEPVRKMTQDECLWLANEWKSGKDYQSGLMTGRTWDRMVSWICNDESDATKFTVSLANSDSSIWGNYGWSTKSTVYKQIFTSDDGKSNWELRKNFSRTKINGTQKYVFPTGEFISDVGRDTKMKNVYDVAGNVWEWTTEESHYSGSEGNWNNNIIRGGAVHLYGYVDPASRRVGDYSGKTTSLWCLRFSLCALRNSTRKLKK